ncbi:hypothetical protein [Ruficoccus sp. ZRK36]|uniref:hypothetical protein n=1 Tax=Ruficoccus sp. ZRK36 TaxID=2866311 RepID=UPI001C7314FD|nr:hypothetical protein [Ruficoccus sp. ZRK36]QYY36810.1 hypothetical protein K0V07_04865 [Ruficoccus sp. ZRK36]
MDEQERATVSQTLLKEFYPLAAQTCNNPEATQQVLFDFLVVAIQQGFNAAEAIAVLTQRPGGLLLKLGNFYGSQDLKGFVEYLKGLEVRDLYTAAGVPAERDFEKDPASGKWRLKATNTQP